MQVSAKGQSLKIQKNQSVVAFKHQFETTDRRLSWVNDITSLRVHMPNSARQAPRSPSRVLESPLKAVASPCASVAVAQ